MTVNKMNAVCIYEQMTIKQKHAALRQFMYIDEETHTVDDTCKTAEQLYPVFQILAFIDREAAITVMNLTEHTHQAMFEAVSKALLYS